MKQKLGPNAELDLLNKQELEDVMRTMVDELKSGFSRPAVTIRDFQATLLDGNGDSGIPGATNNPNPVPFYRVDAGYTFELHRMTVQFEGVDFNTDFAGGYIYLMRATRVIDFANLDDGVPVVFSYTSDAPEFNNGETVDLLVSGGSADTNMIVDIQGTLAALPGELVRT